MSWLFGLRRQNPVHKQLIRKLPNISRSKGIHTMKLSQLKGYNQIFFFKNYAENEAGRLIPDLFLPF